MIYNTSKRFLPIYKSGPEGPDFDNMPLTYKALADGSNYVRLSGTNSNWQYKINDGDWTAYTNNETINLVSGDTVAFSGSCSNPITGRVAGNVEVYGNISSVVGNNSYISQQQFYAMYANQTGLVQASSLIIPYTLIAPSGMKQMFQNCSNLQTAPQLPATSLNEQCYAYMFDQCIALVQPPSTLPAIIASNRCYYNMFNGCNHMTYSPTIALSAIPASGCSWMFNYCGALLDAPQLSATSVGEKGCQQMFDHCTSLTGIPEHFLSGASLVASSCNGMFLNNNKLSSVPTLHFSSINSSTYACQKMFSGCIALTASPEIIVDSNVGNNNFHTMFQGCTGMVSAGAIHVPSTGGWGMQEMFLNCTSLITPPVMDVQYINNNGMQNAFNGCTSLTSTVDFSALTTCPDNYGLQNTFRNCSSITNFAPIGWTVIDHGAAMRGYVRNCTSLKHADLPITTVTAQSGCAFMFCDCTSLTSINCNFNSWPTATYATSAWVRNVAPTGIFYKENTLTETYGEANIPASWTAVNK